MNLAVLKKKSPGVVLVVIMGVMLVTSILIYVSLNVMTQQSRIGEHKLKRIRAYYATHAGMVNATDCIHLTGNVTNYTHLIGAGLTGYPPAGYSVAINYTPHVISDYEINATVTY